MKSNLRVFLLIGSSVIVVGVLLFIFRSSVLNILSNTSYFSPFLQGAYNDKNFEIINEVNNKEFIFDKTINDNPKIVEIVKGTDVDTFKKNIIITSDPTKKGASYLIDNKVVSGYGNQINYDVQQTNLFIYINLETLPPEDFIYHINKNYIGSLLSAAEKNKQDKDGTYQANYEKVRQLTHEISVNNYDTNQYFLIYK